MDNALEKAKTFWQRPEGTTGKILIVAGGLGGGLLVYKYLPPILAWMEMVLENTIYTAGLAAAALVVTSPIWNSKMRTLTGYMFRSGVRALTGWFVTIDPIGILKNYIEDLHKQQEEMDTQIGKLRGTISQLGDTITQNTKQYANSMHLAQAAREKGKRNVLALQARRAGRLEESNVTLQALHDKLKKLYDFLCKLRENSDLLVQDMEDTVSVKETERRAVLAGSSAFSSAMKIMKGDPDKRALFDQSMEYITDDCARRMGIISDYMDTSKGVLDTFDLQNQVFEETALAKLDKMFDADETLMLGPVTDKISDPLAREKVMVGVGTGNGDGDVASLFRRQR